MVHVYYLEKPRALLRSNVTCATSRSFMLKCMLMASPPLSCIWMLVRDHLKNFNDASLIPSGHVTDKSKASMMGEMDLLLYKTEQRKETKEGDDARMTAHSQDGLMDSPFLASWNIDSGRPRLAGNSGNMREGEMGEKRRSANIRQLNRTI